MLVGGVSWELDVLGSTIRLSVSSRLPAAAETWPSLAILAAVAALSAPWSPLTSVSIVPLVYHVPFRQTVAWPAFPPGPGPVACPVVGLLDGGFGLVVTVTSVPMP